MSVGQHPISRARPPAQKAHVGGLACFARPLRNMAAFARCALGTCCAFHSMLSSNVVFCFAQGHCPHHLRRPLYSKHAGSVQADPRRLVACCGALYFGTGCRLRLHTAHGCICGNRALKRPLGCMPRGRCAFGKGRF